MHFLIVILNFEGLQFVLHSVHINQIGSTLRILNYYHYFIIDNARVPFVFYKFGYQGRTVGNIT